MGVDKKNYPWLFKSYPPSTTRVYFWTSDGQKHYGFFVKDINKYIKNVNRWKDEDKNIWFDDKDVDYFEYLS